MEFTEFIFKKDLGRGSFGLVKLAYSEKTKKYYAIKCIRKESIRSEKQI